MWQMLGVSVGSVAEKCESAVARLEAVLTLLGVDSVNSLCADGDPTRNSPVNREKTSEQRPASLWERATQFEALIAVVVNVKQSRLVQAVLQARRRVEDGIRAHRHGAVCRSGSRWRASPDLPLVRICRCRAPCCGCTWSACCRCSGSQSARRVVPHCTQMRASRLPMPFVCVATSSRCCVDAWRRLGWAIRQKLRLALQRSLPTLELTITSSAWSGSVLRPKARPDSRRSMSSITKRCTKRCWTFCPAACPAPPSTPKPTPHCGSVFPRCSVFVQYHWTQHVEPIRGQQSHTRDVLLVLMDWDRSSMRHVLREIPSIKQCELRYRTS